MPGALEMGRLGLNASLLLTSFVVLVLVLKFSEPLFLHTWREWWLKCLDPRDFLRIKGNCEHRTCNSTWHTVTLSTWYIQFSKFSSVTQLCLICDPMNHSMPGLPVHHQLPEFTQTQVHWVGDAIQPSHPLSSPSPPAPNPSQHQGLFQWVNSSHEVAKVLEFQSQHQSFQWTPRTDLL